MKGIVVGIFLLLITACLYENTQVVPSVSCDAISFSKDIRPIMDTRCATTGCHVAGFQLGDFTNYEGVKLKVDDGKFRLRVIETKSMPPLSRLNDDDFAKVQCWLDKGAKNN